MPTPIEERNTGICAQYLGGDTAEGIALDFGLSVAAVRVIIREGKSLRGAAPRVRKTIEERVVTSTHARIGARLSHHRAFTRGIDRRMAADELHWSMQRVASVEQGTHNLTLLDLQDLARFINVSIEELLNDKEIETATPPSPSNQATGSGTLGDDKGVGSHPNVVPFPSPSSPNSPSPAAPTGAGEAGEWEHRHHY
jgi:hypothetical protein